LRVFRIIRHGENPQSAWHHKQTEKIAAARAKGAAPPIAIVSNRDQNPWSYRRRLTRLEDLIIGKNLSFLLRGFRYSGANGANDNRAEDDPLKGSRGLAAIG
jgi:hypothetical protein